MKLEIPKNNLINPMEIARKAGYSYFIDPVSGKESFVFRLTPDYYPRFHLYISTNEKNIIFDLHLDQKKPSYNNNNKHSGEYDGPIVEKELKRIAAWIRHYYQK
ncbi:hypothetical protein D6827_00200 [Candidatus Parcubacteria bacterium]|nr:MAG: hypothetical protein D6827_00200 [Candidatus Parcubacteria bacterium]